MRNDGNTNRDDIEALRKRNYELHDAGDFHMRERAGARQPETEDKEPMYADGRQAGEAQAGKPGPEATAEDIEPKAEAAEIAAEMAAGTDGPATGETAREGAAASGRDFLLELETKEARKSVFSTTLQYMREREAGPDGHAGAIFAIRVPESAGAFTIDTYDRSTDLLSGSVEVRPGDYVAFKAGIGDRYSDLTAGEHYPAAGPTGAAFRIGAEEITERYEAFPNEAVADETMRDWNAFHMYQSMMHLAPDHPDMFRFVPVRREPFGESFAIRIPEGMRAVRDFKALVPSTSLSMAIPDIAIVDKGPDGRPKPILFEPGEMASTRMPGVTEKAFSRMYECLDPEDLPRLVGMSAAMELEREVERMDMADDAARGHAGKVPGE